MMTPNNVNPAQWEQSVGYARAICARLFRDGGSPADAMRAFGLAVTEAPKDWATVVDRIATALATENNPRRKAA